MFSEYLEDYVAKNNPVRVVDVFVEHLELGKLGFNGAEPAITGRLSYHPSIFLKLYIYGYLNRIQSGRRLEKETRRNVELIRLLGRLTPYFKKIARFRKENGKAANNRDRNYTANKEARRKEQIETSIGRYL